MALPDRLKELREKKKMSLQDVADKVGASKAHIWDLERGRSRNPTIELVTSLAKCFGVSVAELLGEDVGNEEEGSRVLGMYRDLKGLSEADLDLIEGVIDRLKRDGGG